MSQSLTTCLCPVLMTCMSIFLESIETGAEPHTAEFLANDMKIVIESAPPNAKIAGAVMDITSANKAAWQLLQDLKPSPFFRVASHMLCIFLSKMYFL